MTVDVASPDEMFGLQALRPSKCPSSPPPSPVARLALLRRAPRQERLRMEVCSLLPQRDCCRFSQHSLDSATIFEDRRPSTEFKELFASLTIPGNPSIDVPVRWHPNKGTGISHARKKRPFKCELESDFWLNNGANRDGSQGIQSVPLRLFGNRANWDGSLTVSPSAGSFSGSRVAVNPFSLRHGSRRESCPRRIARSQEALGKGHPIPRDAKN